MPMKLELVESEEGVGPMAELVAMIGGLGEAIEVNHTVMDRIARALEGIEHQLERINR